MIIGIEIGTWRTVAADPAAHFADVRAVASAAREAGFRLLAPPPQRWTGTVGGLQPMQLMAALASDNAGMAVSTGSLLAAVANPVDLAEQIATLDHAVAGELVIEIRPRASTAEVAPFGVAPEEVPERTIESIGLWRRLWTEDIVNHAGTFYAVPGARPTLRPHLGRIPRIVLLTAGEADVALASRIGAGLSVDADTTAIPMITKWIAAPTERAASGLPVVCRRTVAVPEDLPAQLEAFYQAGCSHLVLRLPGQTAAEVASFAGSCRPAARAWEGRGMS